MELNASMHECEMHVCVGRVLVNRVGTRSSYFLDGLSTGARALVCSHTCVCVNRCMIGSDECMNAL